MRFIKSPLFYLKHDIKMVRDGNLLDGIHPIASIGTEDDFVQFELVHSYNFEDAKQQWERRIKRVNKDNIFVKMGFSRNIEGKEKLLRSFEEVKYKKILFYYDKNNEVNSTLTTSRFEWKQLKRNRVEDFDYNDFLRWEYHYEVDILKLLNGETNYRR